MSKIVWSVSDTNNADLINYVNGNGNRDRLGSAALFALLSREFDARRTPLPFRVCVTSFVDAEGCASFSVERDLRSFSSVAIVGASTRQVSASQVTEISTSVTLRREVEDSSPVACEPLPASAVSRVLYTWRVIRGPSLRDAVRVCLLFPFCFRLIFFRVVVWSYAQHPGQCVGDW